MRREKSMSNETRANKAIAIINAGGTWKDVELAVKVSKSRIQTILREHYSASGGGKSPWYKKLLKKARENEKAREAEKVQAQVEGQQEDVTGFPKEVVVVETGYLLDTRAAGVLNESLDVYIPFFCINELEKLTNSYATAEEILTLFWSTQRIISINLRGREELYEEPNYPVKDRSKGVIALCVELDSLGYRVRLMTNSREIEDLAHLQGCDIDVVRLKKSR